LPYRCRRGGTRFNSRNLQRKRTRNSESEVHSVPVKETTAEVKGFGTKFVRLGREKEKEKTVEKKKNKSLKGEGKGTIQKTEERVSDQEVSEVLN